MDPILSLCKTLQLLLVWHWTYLLVCNSPAISSGIFGFPKKLCAQTMLQTVKEYCSGHPIVEGKDRTDVLRDIRFTNIDPPTVDVFENEFRALFPLDKEL